MDVRTYLEQQQVHPQLIRAVEEFRNQYPVEEKVKYRVSDPMMPFYGTEILEMGIAALLQKENLLLSGSKATGKNVLAENLAWIFQRPTYNISFHVNTGSGDLIGTDTFEDNQVKLRKGSIYQCAEFVAQDHGAAVVADELFAQNKSLCQTIGRGLDLILQMDAILAAIAQQRLKARRISGGGDDQDILNARQHEGGQRIVDHGLIVDRQQLLAGDHRQRIKPGAGTAGQNNAFHNLCTPLFVLKKLCSYTG